ncbi:MAG: hypothetical protein M3033_19470 [Acidobacteriota bacterium]|nr:hypothetical protein [Acidobacteriota bacterium]
MEKEKTQNLAERIALLLQENESSDANFFRLNLEKINQRLDGIEAKLNSQNSNNLQPSTFNLQPSIVHPSQEKFEIAEAFTSEMPESFGDEKPCPYEPTGKPCDHCSMCNSRGF